MSLSFRVLGDAGRDNALLVVIDSGQAVSRLLFDCGQGCLDAVPFAEVRQIDHLCFSHLHMDHVAGFDAFFRCVFDRTDRPNHLWGPDRTAEILHHRLRGYLWNLVGGQQATWHVHDLLPGRVVSCRFELAEAFAESHVEEERSWDRAVLEGPGYTVEALLMDHGTSSVAYVVRERPRRNVEVAKLAALGLRPGPWLQRVRGPQADDEEVVVVEGTPRRLRDLQDDLLVVTPGDSVAYLTDFLLDEAAVERLTDALKGVAAVVCESQYRHADLELACRKYHMTATQVAHLASRAGVGRLVLFHLSDRYPPEEWPDLLAEARIVFPATAFPDHWTAAGPREAPERENTPDGQ
jgi:ribonuclease Z